MGRTYLQYGFVHIDPALAQVRRSNTPFHRSSLKLPPVLGRRKPPEVQMMDAAREFGFKEGYVVSWAACGKTVRDTAEILHISAETVEWHFKGVLKKLDATNKTHAVAKCIAWELIDL